MPTSVIWSLSMKSERATVLSPYPDTNRVLWIVLTLLWAWRHLPRKCFKLVGNVYPYRVFMGLQEQMLLTWAGREDSDIHTCTRNDNGLLVRQRLAFHDNMLHTMTTSYVNILRSLTTCYVPWQRLTWTSNVPWQHDTWTSHVPWHRLYVSWQRLNVTWQVMTTSHVP